MSEDAAGGACDCSSPNLVAVGDGDTNENGDLSSGSIPGGQLDSRRRAVLARRVRLLVAATIGFNIIAAVVAVAAGKAASSTALVGYGLDALIEVASAGAVAWQFSRQDHQARERVALKVIAMSFLALAGYVTVESIGSLLGGDTPEHSTAGIVLAAVTLVIMPFLVSAKRRTGRELGSTSVVADSQQSLLCTYLSAVLLIGLLLNSLLGFPWADPIVALIIAAVAVKEGRRAWRGEHCC